MSLLLFWHTTATVSDSVPRRRRYRRAKVTPIVERRVEPLRDPKPPEIDWAGTPWARPPDPKPPPRPPEPIVEPTPPVEPAAPERSAVELTVNPSVRLQSFFRGGSSCEVILHTLLQAGALGSSRCRVRGFLEPAPRTALLPVSRGSAGLSVRWRAEAAPDTRLRLIFGGTTAVVVNASGIVIPDQT